MADYNTCKEKTKKPNTKSAQTQTTLYKSCTYSTAWKTRVPNLYIEKEERKKKGMKQDAGL